MEASLYTFKLFFFFLLKIIANSMKNVNAGNRIKVMDGLSETEGLKMLLKYYAQVTNVNI